MKQRPDTSMAATPSTVAPLSDPLAELMAAIGQGDRAAFADFFDATDRTIFTIAFRVLVDAAQAEEVTREAYLEMWRTARSYDAATMTVVVWAATIARRRAIDRARAIPTAVLVEILTARRGV